MLAHCLDLLGLAVRMLHFISGVAWIGASFYFNWLENALERANQRDEIAGSLWAVHGGGFYYVEKYKVSPQRIPDVLHWFKWEAYTTWLSGIALLTLVYYFNAGIFLVDAAHPGMSAAQLVGLGISVIVFGWFGYDTLCKSRLGENGKALAAIGTIAVSATAYGLSQVMSARGVYMHVGALLGTCMAANVFFVIIPGQKNMVDAAKAGRAPDASKGKKALLRSRHNNYLTLPVLFVMISNHFPFTYSHAYGWLILVGLSLSGGFIRHWFNLKGKGVYAVWPLALAGVLFAAVAWATSPKIEALASGDGRQVEFAEAHAIINKHCVRCHSSAPTDEIFKVAPAGMILETPERIQAAASLIKERAVVLANMPFGNKTGMTQEERNRLGQWIDQGAKLTQ